MVAICTVGALLVITSSQIVRKGDLLAFTIQTSLPQGSFRSDLKVFFFVTAVIHVLFYLYHFFAIYYPIHFELTS